MGSIPEDKILAKNFVEEVFLHMTCSFHVEFMVSCGVFKITILMDGESSATKMEIFQLESIAYGERSVYVLVELFFVGAYVCHGGARLAVAREFASEEDIAVALLGELRYRVVPQAMRSEPMQAASYPARYGF